MPTIGLQMPILLSHMLKISDELMRTTKRSKDRGWDERHPKAVRLAGAVGAAPPFLDYRMLRTATNY